MKDKRLRRVKILCVAVLALMLLGPFPRARVKNLTIERVVDGDTVEATYGQQILKLRLAFIDAPELKQRSLEGIPIGLHSKQFLEAMVLGKEARVRLIKKDRYGRYLAHIFLGEKDVNLAMVEEGHALIYRYYEFQSTAQKIEYINGEILAKRGRRGMWGLYAFHDPHAFRRLKKKSFTKEP